MGYHRTEDDISGYRMCFAWVYSLISGSAVRSAVTKLEGNNPTPWYVSPFHQLGSLKLKKKKKIKQKIEIVAFSLLH